jgi:hypothetical protein
VCLSSVVIANEVFEYLDDLVANVIAGEVRRVQARPALAAQATHDRRARSPAERRPYQVSRRAFQR